MLEKAVFVRHGDYEDDCLTPLGERQIRGLVPRIQSVLGDASPVLVLSSPRQRAIQTASLLCDGLGLSLPGFQTCDELAEELRDLVNDLNKIHTFFTIATKDAKYVLVSTHKPVAQYYPWWYAKQFGIEVSSLSPANGDAIFLDMRAKTLIRF